MSFWPPDGLWRVTAAPGVDGITVVPVGGASGVYTQPVPAALNTGPAHQLLMFFVGGISASGNTAIWTPTAGTRFNLAGAFITITGNATRAVASGSQVTLRDGGTADIWGGTVFLPAAAGTTIGNDIILGPVTFDAPYRSSALNNVLNVRLAAALTAGACSVSAWGFETT